MQQLWVPAPSQPHTQPGWLAMLYLAASRQWWLLAAQGVPGSDACSTDAGPSALLSPSFFLSVVRVASPLALAGRGCPGARAAAAAVVVEAAGAGGGRPWAAQAWVLVGAAGVAAAGLTCLSSLPQVRQVQQVRHRQGSVSLALIALTAEQMRTLPLARLLQRPPHQQQCLCHRCRPCHPSPHRERPLPCHRCLPCPHQQRQPLGQQAPPCGQSLLLLPPLATSSNRRPPLGSSITGNRRRCLQCPTSRLPT